MLCIALHTTTITRILPIPIPSLLTNVPILEYFNLAVYELKSI